MLRYKNFIARDGRVRGGITNSPHRTALRFSRPSINYNEICDVPKNLLYRVAGRSRVFRIHAQTSTSSLNSAMAVDAGD